MKPSALFYICIICILILAVPAWLAMRAASESLASQSVEAAKGVGGYATLEEQEDERREKFQRELGWSEDRIRQERLVRVQERILSELRSKEK